MVLLFGGGTGGNAAIIAFDDASLPVGDNPQSIAAADCDGDGYADLVSANFDSNDVTIFHGGPGGRLQFAATIETPPQPSGASCGDFTGDGIGDVAVASWASGTVTIFQGDSDGGFTATSTVQAGSQPRSVAAADLNRDGALDLVVANAQSSDLTLLFGNGQGAFPAVGTVRLQAIKQTNRPRSAQVADFNLDGIPDIAVASQGDPSLRILLGDGVGFRLFDGPLPVAGKLLGLAASDLNADDIPDLALLSTEGTLSLLLGSPSLTFTASGTIALRSTAKAVAIGGFNGDAWPDLAVSHSDSNAIQLISAVGPGQFPACGSVNSPYLCPTSSSKVTSVPSNAVLRTLPDGSKQLVFLDRASRTLSLLELPTLNSASVTVLATLTGDPERLALADLDGDGIDDAIVALRIGRSVLLQVLKGTEAGGYVFPDPGTQVCGNGILEGTEQCDDGNVAARDDCGPGCTVELAGGVLFMDVVDFDGDGHLDVVVLDGRYILRILFGNGLRQFKAVRLLGKVARRGGVAVGDFNGDGFVDLAMAPKRRRDGNLWVYFSDGTGLLTPQSIPTSPMLAPMIAVDLDRNGFVDLVALRKSRPYGLTVLFSDAAGPLRLSRLIATPPRGLRSLHVADFDEDGWLDVLTTGFRRLSPLLFTGSSTGQFGSGTPVAFGAAGVDLVVADFDDDQHQDLVSCDPTAGAEGCRVYYGNGVGGFASSPFPQAPSVGREARGAAASDLDGDGHVDLAGISRRDDRLVVYFQGPAAASVVLETGSMPSALEVADLNGDGHDDLIVANEGSQDISLFTNLGNRLFNTLARIKLPAGPSGPVGMTLDDADGDGRPDIAVVQAATNRVTLLLNQGAGFAALATLSAGPEPRDVALGNLNGDDVLDIVTANRGNNTLSIFLSTANGTFVRSDMSSGGLRPWALETPDLNGDGFGDVIVLNEQASSTILAGSLLTFVNDGAGGFGVVTDRHVRGREYPSRMCVGDFNGDGTVDVAVGSIFTGDLMTLNGAGDGSWGGDQRDFPVADAVTGISCHDADGDGRVDIAFARRRAGDVGVILTGAP